MIDEGVVLLRVEHLQQRRRRVAPEVVAQLVDFVEHEQRVARADAAHGLDDAAGHGPDVGAAVAANLRLVTHAAQADAHELAAQRAGDGAAERGLARARRADEAQDGTAQIVGGDATDGDVLQDAVLDLLQPVVVGVEHGGGVGHVEIVGRLLHPRQVENPVDIGADDADLRRHWRHGRQPREFLFRLGPHVFRQVLGRHGGAQLVQLLGEDVQFAQLALDDAHLLAQEVLAVGAIDLLLHLALDFVLKLQYVQLLGQQDADHLEPLVGAKRLHDLLPRGHGHGQAGGDEVGQPARFVDVEGVGVGLFGQTVVQADDLLEQGQHGAHQRLGRRLPLGRLRDDARPDADVRFPLGIGDDLHPPPPLGQHAGGVVGHAQDAADGRLRADAEQVVLLRVEGVVVTLGGNDEVLVVAVGGVDGRQRSLAADEQRHDHLRI